MTRLRRAVAAQDLTRIIRAQDQLRAARENLKMAGARQAARYVARAEKSAGGAYRHAVNVKARLEAER